MMKGDGYYCYKCGSIFGSDDAGSIVEYGRRYMCCPYCGSEDYEEAGTCDMCGDGCAPEKHICKDCEDDLDFIIRKAVKEITDSYNWLTEEEAAEVLFDYCEDKGFSLMFREGEK